MLIASHQFIEFFKLPIILRFYFRLETRGIRGQLYLFLGLVRLLQHAVNDVGVLIM